MFLKCSLIWAIYNKQIYSKGTSEPNFDLIPKNLQDALLMLVPKNRLFGACFSEISHDFSEKGRQILVKPHYGSTNAKVSFSKTSNSWLFELIWYYFFMNYLISGGFTFLWMSTRIFLVDFLSKFFPILGKKSEIGQSQLS